MYTKIVLYQKIGIDYVLKYVCSTKICRVRLVLIVLSKKKKKKLVRIGIKICVDILCE